MRRFPTTLLLLGFLAAVRPAHGQRLPDHLQSPGFAALAGPRADTAGYRSNAGGAGLGAIVGGAAGFILGGLAGGCLGGGEDLGALGDAMVGGIVGGTLGISEDSAIFIPMLQIAASVIAETSVGRARARG
jgi:hypothetical protein